MNGPGQINIHPRANAVVLATDKLLLKQRNQPIKSINHDLLLAWRITSACYYQNEVNSIQKMVGDELDTKKRLVINSEREAKLSNDRVYHSLKYFVSI